MQQLISGFCAIDSTVHTVLCIYVNKSQTCTVETAPAVTESVFVQIFLGDNAWILTGPGRGVLRPEPRAGPAAGQQGRQGGSGPAGTGWAQGRSGGQGGAGIPGP